MLLYSLLIGGLSPALADETPSPNEIHVSMDLQGHPAMHLTWKFFDAGLTNKQPKRTYKHQFRQSVYTPYLDQSGVRLFLMAAMAAEKARNPEQARQLILDQFAYVEAFIARNNDRYALAKTPAQARQLLTETDKMVVVHSIEGGHHLLNGPEDAAFWADQGVALMTLMHLRDDELGGAGILPMGIGPLINPTGAKNRRRGTRRGLTERGTGAVEELTDAGILVDLSHMTSASVDDTLAVTASIGATPIVTHGRLASISNSELSMSDAQVLEVYRQGGFFALGLATDDLNPAGSPQPEDFCPDTIEAWAHHYNAVLDLVGEGRAIGWSSDWNGWVSHAAPVYGPRRCRPVSTLTDPLPIDTLGMVHPGFIPNHFERLDRMGVALEPIARSSEQLLRMWERARERRPPPTARHSQ